VSGATLIYDTTTFRIISHEAATSEPPAAVGKGPQGTFIGVARAGEETVRQMTITNKSYSLPVLVLAAYLIVPVVTDAQVRRTQTSSQNSQPPIRTLALPQAVPADDALAVMKDLQEKGILVLALAGQMGRQMGFQFTGSFTKEHCFGWRFADVKQVIGESSGDYYGVKYNSSASGDKEFQMVGFLHLERGISIANKPVAPGTYVVYAGPDELVFDNKEKGFSAEVHLPLPRRLDQSQFVNEKGGRSPRYSLELGKPGLLLAIGDNKLAVTAAKN
jgi:hypothetical protein